MLFEFALEPSLIDNWEHARYFLEQFGVSKGRLISDFPRGGWENHVLQGCGALKDVERARVRELLKVYRPYVVSFDRPWVNGVPWLPNAEYQHSIKPFRLIVAKTGPKKAGIVVLGEEIHDGLPLWDVRREESVERSEAALTSAVSLLLQISREILLIDPYFSPWRPQFLRTLQSFVKSATIGGRSLSRIEYHLDAAKHNDALAFSAECLTQIPRLLPKDLELRVVRWKQKVRGDDLHARYVLTERGGVRIDHGLDCATNLGERTDISLLDHILYRRHWANFQTATGVAFDLVDQTTIIGTAI